MVQPRQEQVSYQMDPVRALSGDGWTLTTTTPYTSPELETILSNQSGLERRPLHLGGMIVQAAGVWGPDGPPHDDLDGPWTLYRRRVDLSTNPARLRLAVRYSYYNTSGSTDGTGINYDEFLPCFDESQATPMGTP